MAPVWICFHLFNLILTAKLTVSAGRHTAQQQCGVANLPEFGDRRGDDEYLGRPPDDRLQAIVPAYTFNCTGRVTEWRACVHDGGSSERYYIQFQVWRPIGVPGCYALVGYNAPPEPIVNPENGRVTNADQLLQPSDPEDHCVLLPVSEDEQIEFQPNDVIGYYADRFRENGDDPDDGGVQVVSDQNVVVYHRIDVPLDDLKTQYAIPDLGPDPSSCGFELEGSDSSLFQLTSSTSGAPILSLSLTAVVISGIRSNDILFSTSTVPGPKPTSALTAILSVSVSVPSSSNTINGSVCGTGCGEGSSGSTGASNLLSVIVGVACALLVLISASVIIIAVLVCLKKRKKGPDVVDNVAYISGSREETRENMMPSEGEAHIFTSTNEAYGTKMYLTTDVSTSTNPAYQAAPCQSGCESFVYDYPRPE